ncbi:hypothetical protein EMMF5_003263 [Cystobasidiomycetes sp. EMM_F5]
MVKEVATLSEFNSAVESRGVTVVDFHATWCGPCKVIAPAYQKLSQEYKQATFLKVDVDKLQDVAQSAGVRAMPTFNIYKGGKKVATVQGANARELENAIRTHAGPPSQNASSGHVWGAGQTLGDSTTPSQPVAAAPMESVLGLVEKFNKLEPPIRVFGSLILVYLVYTVYTFLSS